MKRQPVPPGQPTPARTPVRAPTRQAPLLLRALRRPEDTLQWPAADWDLLLRQASSAQLHAGLAGLLAERGLLAAVPAAARRHLEWAEVLGQRHAQAVVWEVMQIQRALAPLRMPVLLLKGAAYAMAGLPMARGRLFADIDILVPRERLDEVEAALMLHGWAGQHQDAYDQRYYRQWMHELPPMQHVRRRSLIDVHHAILPPTAAARPDARLLRDAALALPATALHPPAEQQSQQPGAAGRNAQGHEVGQAGAAALLLLAPVDLVLHSASHLFYNGELSHGLRDLLDLHRLLLHYAAQPGFHSALAPRARQLQLERPLFYALRYGALLLHTPLPAALLGDCAGFAPPAPLLACMDALYSRALQPAHPSCGGWLAAAARLALYVRGNWLRMPPLMLTRHLLHKALLPPRPAPDGAAP